MVVNRQAEEISKHKLYNIQFFDKRNRLCHNMIMEHFEVHTEQLEDLLVDIQKYGPRILTDIPEGREMLNPVSLDDFALIDELSGLNQYLENFMNTRGMPETVKDRIRARMITYSGAKPKDFALQEMRVKLYGDQR